MLLHECCEAALVYSVTQLQVLAFKQTLPMAAAAKSPNVCSLSIADEPAVQVIV